MKLYLRILAYGKPYLTQGVLGFFSLVLYNFFSVFSIALVIPFLQIIFSQGDSQAMLSSAKSNADPSMMQRAYLEIEKLILTHGTWNVLIGLCIVLGISIFLKSFFRYMSAHFVVSFEQGVIKHMRMRLFNHLSVLSMSFFTGKRKGGIINVLVSDVQVVQESVIRTVQSMLSDPVAMILLLVSLFLISWKLTLFTLLVLPVTGLFINFIAKSLKRKARKGQEKLGTLIAVLDEFISGIRIVKSFSSENHERKKYGDMNDDYFSLMVALRRRSNIASPLTEVLSIFVVITIILYGGNLILSGDGQLEPSAFIGFIALFGSFIQPIKTFSGSLSKIQRGIASFQRIEEFLEIEEDVKEAENAIPLPEFKESIRYENVWFRYEDEDVLKKVNLEVRLGETVALVGPSGGGKSTLADLLPRFYDPVEGKITIDGKDLRDIKVDDLRGKIGVVTQEGILFHDSIRNNIAYGDPNPDLDRVRESARIANAHEFIEKLPEGYATNIGERGTKLSGGQRQRISIARAIYKNAPILILDEATSALDSESERLVQEALDKLTTNRTSIVIAHRLSTIVNADNIYVIDKGEIVESGSHAELLEKRGVYHNLYSIQFASSMKG